MNIKTLSDSQKSWEQFYAQLLFTKKATSPNGDEYTMDYAGGKLTIYDKDGGIVDSKDVQTVIEGIDFVKSVIY
jgi:hypothetical protein